MMFSPRELIVVRRSCETCLGVLPYFEGEIEFLWSSGINMPKLFDFDIFFR